ncbi:MAG: exodeoxyribonuclease VII small subunit [Spirochaetia bacterium]|nr:exodeoxyribonuclease VII small subunit [Spirochaetia bacterium]
MKKTGGDESAEMTDGPSVEESIRELESIVESLESGKMDLDESFKKFEKAVSISKGLKKKLDAYERKIEMVQSAGEEGQIATEKFEA